MVVRYNLIQIGIIIITLGFIMLIIETYIQLYQGCCFPIPIYGFGVILFGIFFCWIYIVKKVISNG